MTEDTSFLAMDLGGTKIAAALVTPAGEILCQEQIPTLAEEGLDAVVDRLLAAIDSVISNSDLSRFSLTGITIASAGAIDADQGIVTDSPNLPGWSNVPLRDIMEQALGLRTFLVNDASAAALGEHRFGAGRGASNLVYVTVSTGIGGGIIIDGKLYSGASGSAGEVGHMAIDINGPRCNCGNVGCLEVLASGKAVAREAQRLIAQGAKTKMVELAEGEAANITARVVAAAAREGDRVAREIVSKAATYLGVGLANLVNLFNPEVIVVGGGLAKMGDMLLDTAREVATERAFRLPAQRVRIVPSELGDNAAMLGAVAFAQTLSSQGQS